MKAYDYYNHNKIIKSLVEGLLFEQISNSVTLSYSFLKKLYYENINVNLIDGNRLIIDLHDVQRSYAVNLTNNPIIIERKKYLKG